MGNPPTPRAARSNGTVALAIGSKAVINASILIRGTAGPRNFSVRWSLLRETTCEERKYNGQYREVTFHRAAFHRAPPVTSAAVGGGKIGGRWCACARRCVSNSENNIFLAEPNLFKIFDIPVKTGNPEVDFKRPPLSNRSLAESSKSRESRIIGHLWTASCRHSPIAASCQMLVARR